MTTPTRAPSDFDYLASLLRKHADDPAVVALTGRTAAQLAKADGDYRAFVELKSLGLSVIFSEAAFILDPAAFVDPRALHVGGVHLYRDSYDGYAQYLQPLPGGVILGDAEAIVLAKLGPPVKFGGGSGWSAHLKRAIPRWLDYAVGDATLHFQLDDDGTVDLVTLSVPKVVRP